MLVEELEERLERCQVRHTTLAPPHPPILTRRAQEELEEKLERYQVRRAPLGLDRHQRRYWWGLAGHRPVVWVEDTEVGGTRRGGACSSLWLLDQRAVLPLLLACPCLAGCQDQSHATFNPRLPDPLCPAHSPICHRAAGAPSPPLLSWTSWWPRWTAAGCASWNWQRWVGGWANYPLLLLQVTPPPLPPLP